VISDGDAAVTDAGEVPAVVGDGGVEEVAALHPQNRTAEASTRPHPGLRLQTCRNPRVRVRLRCIGPPRMIRPSSRRVDRCELFVGQLAKLACLTFVRFEPELLRSSFSPVQLGVQLWTQLRVMPTHIATSKSRSRREDSP
jgi:hypothetical protein